MKCNCEWPALKDRQPSNSKVPGTHLVLRLAKGRNRSGLAAEDRRRKEIDWVIV